MITHNRPCLISFLCSSNFYILYRMISTDNSLYSVSDIILILISRFQKPIQLFQKLSHIKRNRAPNMNQIILRLLQPFLRHQLLFIQLLTRSKPSSCQDRNNFFSEFFHKTMNYCIILKNSIKKRVPDFSETLLSIIFLLFLLSYLPIQQIILFSNTFKNQFFCPHI